MDAKEITPEFQESLNKLIEEAKDDSCSSEQVEALTHGDLELYDFAVELLHQKGLHLDDEDAEDIDLDDEEDDFALKKAFQETLVDSSKTIKIDESFDEQIENLIENDKFNIPVTYRDVKLLAQGDETAYTYVLTKLKEANVEIDEDFEDNEDDDYQPNDSDLKNIDDDSDEDEDLLDKDEDTDSFDEYSKDIEEELEQSSNSTTDIDMYSENDDTYFYSEDPVKIYLREIGQIDRLKPEEEIELSKQIQAGLKAARQLKEAADKNINLTAEEREHLNKLVDDGHWAQNHFMEANLRLVVFIAKRYQGRGMQFPDLIQEGNNGLYKAVNKFNADLGYKFATYATWWIKQSIARAIADEARTIRIPVHMVETINKMTRLQRRLTQELHREPTTEELAKAMNMSPEKIQNIQKISMEPVSLEKPIGEEEDSTLSDFVSDQESMNPLEYTEDAKFKEAIDYILSTLTPREEQVLRLRYGLADGKQHTLEDVGKEFNVTRERIRQIEAKAIRRLKHPTRKKYLEQYRH